MLALAWDMVLALLVAFASVVGIVGVVMVQIVELEYLQCDVHILSMIHHHLVLMLYVPLLHLMAALQFGLLVLYLVVTWLAT